MKIKRDKLLNDLQNFALRGNGVIIGSPGVGKTYLLRELRRNLEAAEIPELFLPIDQLGDGTDETLKHELLIEENLIEFLKSISLSHRKGIILFDAFDTARNERTRKNFLNLIQRAIQDLNRWNIIVTVRTYDATKSQELLDMFGNPDGEDIFEYQSKDICCRHFTIPPFSEDEILQVLDQIKCPQKIYFGGSQDFKNILATPFNLWLLEKIIKTSKELPDFSQIHSEVQLFQMFWQRRIKDASKELILNRIAQQMLEERSLSVKQSDVYENFELDKPPRKAALDHLLSDEILTKVSSTRQRIAFSHNILFDYAISVLLIEDEPQNLEEFITEDPSRPLFLRPSLTYFFTRLWYYDNSESFWRAFWHIFPSNQSVHLRLVARLIPTSVIANETHEIEQLTPLLEKLRDRDETANEAIVRLLQALRMLQVSRDSLWVNFFNSLSRHLDSKFAWDLATLTSDILDRAIEKENADVVHVCGQVGRRLLEWVWEKKETSDDDWYNRLGGHWAVPLVAKTYHTSIEESRDLLNKVLELTNEDHFPIDFLRWLTDNVDKIWDHDPEFVISIYRTVFAHQFTSEGKTQKGGPVFGITTYRSQDFRMCQYRLVKHFPKFLQEKPIYATQAVIQSLNYSILKEHIIRYHREATALENLIETFSFRGETTYFVKDNSYIWDQRKRSDEPIELADKLFEFIEELTVSEEPIPLLDSFLDIFRDQVWVAFFWKRLLKTASKFPKVFASRLFELCIAKPVLLHLETSYELGLFLEKAASEFTSDQLRQIEENILALPIEGKDQENADYLTRHRDSLIAQIPKKLLSTEEAKLIRKKMERENNVPENRPPITIDTWSESYTEEKWLRDKGVDTTTPENQELQQYSKTLEKFSDDWKKDDPTSEAVEFIIPHLRLVYTTTSDTTESNELINILWRKLVECASILAKIANNLDSDSFAFCRQIILEGARHELPRPNPELDAQFDSTGYSPFPRHEATKGLSILAYSNPDTEILDTIELLAHDPVPSVRMLIAMQLRNVYAKNHDRFWEIIYKMSESEENLIVQECLYRTLNFLVAHRKENENKTTEVMSKLLKHTPSPELKTGTSDPFINLLMWLVIERENSWALGIFKDTYCNDPILFSNILTRAVRCLIKYYVAPKQLEKDEGPEIVKRAINCVSNIITVTSNKIKKLCVALKEHRTDEIEQNLQDTYDVIDQVITRLYYTFAHERSQSEKPVEKIPNDLRCHFYDEVKPLMNQVIDFAKDPESGVMFAPTAHYFIQLLKSFLGCDAKGVLHLAQSVASSSERFGYTLDSIAVMDIVELVEIVLADYRHVVKDDEECMEDLLNLLDLFAKTGWTDALNLVWRLDEVFR
jgi:hypothetical protein